MRWAILPPPRGFPAVRIPPGDRRHQPHCGPRRSRPPGRSCHCCPSGVVWSRCHFRSPGQEKTVAQMLTNPPDLLICLATAGGKSFAIINSAHLAPTQITLVFTPFVTQCCRLQACLCARHLPSSDFSGPSTPQAGTVFVTAEALHSRSSAIQTFVTTLVGRERLAHIFSDECLT